MKNIKSLAYLFLSWVIGMIQFQTSSAQDLEEEFDKFLNEIKEDYNQTLLEQNQEYSVFVDSLNSEYLKKIEADELEFSHFLKENWASVDIDHPILPDSAVKPLSAPVYKSRTPSEKLVPIIQNQDTLNGEESVLILPIQKDTSYEKQLLKINFFGSEIRFVYDRMMKTKLADDPDNLVIGSLFDNLCKTNYIDLLKQAWNQKERLRLNDWGYYLLIKAVAEEINAGERNSSAALTWFLLLKSNYLVKLAYFKNRVILLMPIKQNVYGIPSVQLDHRRYYAMDFAGEMLFTYLTNYPQAYTIIDLTINYPMNFEESILNRNLKFNYDKEFLFEIKYNKNYIDFYKTYPLTDLSVYLNAPFSQTVRESLINTLLPQLVDKTKKQQVEYLLKFNQNGFEYKQDQEQFGAENFFFAEEMFFYPYSDCEDRAILFAKLVDELLGLDVVLLDFPGHVAVAVEIPEMNTGDYLSYEGKRMTICDPSFLNAPVGEIMPEYEGQTASVVEITPKQNLTTTDSDTWNKAGMQGTFRSTSNQQTIIDSRGNLYLAGCFFGKLECQNLKLENTSDNSCSFVVKLDSSSVIQWGKKVEGEGKVCIQAITLDSENNSIVGGTYDRNISIDGSILTNSDTMPGIFLLKINNSGNVGWLRNIPFNTTNIPDIYNLSIIVDSAGNVKLFNPEQISGSFKMEALQTDNRGNYLLSGFRIEAAVKKEYAKNNEYDIVSDFIKEYEKYADSASDTTMAICRTILSVLNNEGILVKGDQVGMAIKKALNGNIKSVGLINEQVGNIDRILNVDGLIRVFMMDKTNIYLGKILIENDAKFRILSQSDRIRIEALQGFYVGSEYHRDTLNYIDIMNDLNKFYIDYSNHYNKKFTMKPDVL